MDPALGQVDERSVREAFLDAIGAGPGVERLMAQQWRAGGLPRVERRAPLLGRTGKILHLHQRMAPEIAVGYRTFHPGADAPAARDVSHRARQP